MFYEVLPTTFIFYSTVLRAPLFIALSAPEWFWDTLMAIVWHQNVATNLEAIT